MPMLTEEQTAEVTTTRDSKNSITMGVDNESISHIQHILTDLYADPYVAISREYISNAYDASVKQQGIEGATSAKLARPIEVTLPTSASTPFLIKDYGCGMNRNILATVFPFYGASTKRKDDNQVGGYGLGAKSALAVASVFRVDSISEGFKNSVIIQKNEEGVGVLDWLNEEPIPTDEPSGTTITLHLPDWERIVRLFRGSSLLLGFAPESIRVNGELVVNSIFNTDLYAPVNEYGYIAEEAFTVNRYSHSSQQVVTVGPISYRVDVSQFKHGTVPLAGFSVLTLPPNSVDVTPARDDLIMNPRTLKALQEAASKFAAAVPEFVNARASLLTPRAAMKLAIALGHTSYRDPILYHGEVVPSPRVVLLPNVHGEEELIHWTGAGQRATPKTSRALPGTEALLITNIPEGEMQRVARYRKEWEQSPDGYHDQRIIFTTHPQTQFDKWSLGSAKTVLTCEEFLNIVIPIRQANARIRREEARAARALGGVPDAAVEIQDTLLTAWHFAPMREHYSYYREYYSSDYSNRMTVRDLAESNEGIVYLASDIAAPGLREQYTGLVQSSGRFKQAERLLYAAAEKIDAALGNQRYIRFGANVNAERFLLFFPGARSYAQAIHEANEVLAQERYSVDVLASLTLTQENEDDTPEWVKETLKSKKNMQFLSEVAAEIPESADPVLDAFLAAVQESAEQYVEIKTYLNVIKDDNDRMSAVLERAREFITALSPGVFKFIDLPSLAGWRPRREEVHEEMKTVLLALHAHVSS